MNKKLIRLTESDLHRIVEETVNKIINEHDMYAMGRGIGKLYRKTNMYNNHAAINQRNGGDRSTTQACYQHARDCDDKRIKMDRAAEKALGSNPHNNDDFGAGWEDAVYGRRLTR